MLTKYVAVLTEEINQAERQFIKEVKRHRKMSAGTSSLWKK